MDTFTKVLITGILWYICHKYIRKGLNSNKKWNKDDETDALLGGLAACTKQYLKTIIFT